MSNEHDKIVGDDGEFHVEDEAVDLSGTIPEAWVALVLVNWGMSFFVV